MMAHLAAALISRPALEPPLDPDREEARRWAAEELSDPRYRKAAPNWWEEWWRQVTDWLQSLLRGDPWAGADVTVPLVAVLGIVIIAVAVILARPRLNARHAPSRNVFDDSPAATAESHRRRAVELADDGDWSGAVVEQFRALVRSAEERVVIDPRPGRTADETAVELAPVFPSLTARLSKAATLFDGILYGKELAARADYEVLRELDAEMEATRPARVPMPDVPVPDAPTPDAQTPDVSGPGASVPSSSMPQSGPAVPR